MLIRLILLFTVIPLTELYFLIQIGKYLGAFPTIMIVFITGIIGGLLARSQGLSIYRKITLDLQNGVIPTDSLIDGLFILIAGALLITPGVLTDVFGFVLIIPGCRIWLRKRLRDYFRRRLDSGKFHYYSGYNPTGWEEEEEEEEDVFRR